MSAMSTIWTEITSTMWNVSEALDEAADGGDPEVVEQALIESIAHLANALKEYRRVTT